MAPTTTPNQSRLCKHPRSGPPKIAPSTITATDTAAAIRRRSQGPIRDTSQPARTATGSTSTSSARTNFSATVGLPAMSTVWAPVSDTTSIELAATTANAASAGAERLHTRRTRAAADRAHREADRAARNQCSAAKRSSFSAAGGLLPREWRRPAHMRLTAESCAR